MTDARRFAVTPRQFALFRKECRRCVAKWHLDERWSISYEFTPHLGGDFARCSTRVLGRVVTLSLCTRSTVQPTDEEVVEAARHECTHLLLAPLADILSSRYLTPDEEKQAVESTVRHVQSLLP